MASPLQLIVIEEESSGRWKSVKAPHLIQYLICDVIHQTGHIMTRPHLEGCASSRAAAEEVESMSVGPGALWPGRGLGGAVRNVTRTFPRRLDALWCERPSYWISPSAITHVPCTRHSKPWTSQHSVAANTHGKTKPKIHLQILTPTRIAFRSFTQFIWHTVALK